MQSTDPIVSIGNARDEAGFRLAPATGDIHRSLSDLSETALRVAELREEAACLLNLSCPIGRAGVRVFRNSVISSFSENASGRVASASAFSIFAVIDSLHGASLRLVFSPWRIGSDHLAKRPELSFYTLTRA